MFLKEKVINFALNTNLLVMETPKNLNRIKAALADAGKTSKWLAEQLGKDTVTISKWCTNRTQPSLETLMQIANTLKVDVRKLLVP